MKYPIVGSDMKQKAGWIDSRISMREGKRERDPTDSRLLITGCTYINRVIFRWIRRS